VLETERRRKGKRCKRLGCVQPRLSSVWHTSREFADGVRLKFTGLSGVHRTVRCAPDCPVSQRSAARSTRDTWPSQRLEGCTGLSGVHRTVSGVHRTVSDAPTALDLQRSTAPILEGNRAPDSVRWCTRLSGAPPDRRQGLPSWIALNGS
jgi:hypothetical protein